MNMMVNATQPLHVFVVVLFLLCMETWPVESESLPKVGKMVMQTERKALLASKRDVGVADKLGLVNSWNKEEDCCKWKGVGCDYFTGHVTHLYFSSFIATSSKNSTTGISIGSRISHLLLDLPYLTYLDLSSNFLGGLMINDFNLTLTKLVHLDLSDSYIGRYIPYQIGNLSNLQYLNLSYCDFSGSIPKFIGSLNSLRYLDISSNNFTGVIPHELENLSKLEHFDLAYNSFLTGGGNFEWLFNLSSLRHLDLSFISINQSTIWPSFIQRIPSISVLHLNGCNLSAQSTFSNFSSSISALHLGGNYITSSIFDWLSQLNGSLIELNLRYNVLEGRIPESFGHMNALTHLDLYANQLNGDLTKSIRNLSNLKVVDFSYNFFTGNLENLIATHFPLLQELLIHDNQFTGSLPDFTILSSLRILKVSYNQLNGHLPTVFEHHSALQFLDLSNNHLRGSLPDFTGFSSLRFLYLYSNEFSGSLPDFTKCSSLRVLFVNGNQLTKWEAQSTGLVSSLEELDLSKNSIRSTISEAHLSNLSRLEYLRTSFNFLTFEFSSDWLPSFQLRELCLASCKLGPKFPNWIRNQRHIDHLDLSNSQILGTLPIWFWNFSRTLYHLNLSSNKITGKFHSKRVHVQEIDLSSNYFDGPLPKISAECLQINLSQNKFSGTLFSLSAVDDLSLRFLDISHNQLSGALPENWMHFQLLVYLNLGSNRFSGRIPRSIGRLSKIETLILRNNKLYGELPESLSNCSSLGFINFGLNKLSGMVPSWIGEDLPYLYALILKFNRFSGSISDEICHLSNLHFLDLSMNRISGTIPPCFDNLTSIIQKDTEVAEHSYFSSIAPSTSLGPSYSYFDNALARWKGQELVFGRNFAYLKVIDLSINQLTGEIPIGLTRLSELKGLNLSGNMFYGNVPQEIGKLKVLESLDLSTNIFSGEIPSSMSGLNFLAFLNLSNNNFLGRIPSGTQLQGFSNSTYQGNSGLCGKPLTNICSEDEPADYIRPSSIEYEVDIDDSEYERWLYISVVLGFSITFWGIIGTLVLCRRWRHAYFLFLDHLKEQTYVAIAHCQISGKGLKISAGLLG